MTNILEIDGVVLRETDYSIVGEDIRLKTGVLGGRTLVLYSLNDQQMLTRYEVYKTLETKPTFSLLWTSQVGVNIDTEQAEMLRGNLPQPFLEEYNSGKFV